MAEPKPIPTEPPPVTRLLMQAEAWQRERVALFEQLYRGLSILKREPYAREQ